MDSKRTMKKLRAMTRRDNYLMLVLLCICLLMLVAIFALLDVEKNNVSRYRAENYDRFAGNESSFRQVIAGTDGFLENLSLSLYALPYFENASAQEVRDCLLDKDVRMAENESPFDKSTRAHDLLGRLQGLVMANQRYTEIALYNKRSGASLALAGNGRYSVLCTNRQELDQLLQLQGDWQGVDDGALVAARPTDTAAAQLYVVRQVGESMLLLCGLENSAWRETLLADNSGRSYRALQILLTLPDGTVLQRNENVDAGTLELDESQIDAAQPIQILGRYTLMHFASEKPDYLLTAILRETGTTSVLASQWFQIFIIVNALWLVTVSAIGAYMLLRVFKPLRSLSSQVPGAGGEGDELEKIAGAIYEYDQRLLNCQTTIALQIQQLRRAYLAQLALNQYPSVTQEQLEKLKITQLLEKYILITIYPDDGRWARGDFSMQENNYRQHVTATAVQELLRVSMQGVELEFLLCEMSLLVVVPIWENAQEESVQNMVQRCMIEISVQLKKRFQFGISKVHCGAERFSLAYHEAMRHAALLEERISGRSEDISLNTLLKQNLHMADLVYMEKYDGAFACFEEMITTICKQKSRHLRNQQLASLLSLTYCMLTETNGANAGLVEQMDIDVGELLKPDGEQETLARWQKVFGELEARKEKRMRWQYSEQFAQIYQYMHAHLRDPELSLSLLAERFGMSVSTLSREFQKNLGQGFLSSLHYLRIEAAKYEIEHSGAPLSDIAVAVGYTNALTMTRAFKKYMGCTPGSFRKKEAAY